MDQDVVVGGEIGFVGPFSEECEVVEQRTKLFDGGEVGGSVGGQLNNLEAGSADRWHCSLFSVFRPSFRAAFVGGRGYSQQER